MGFDTDPALLVHSSLAEGLINAVAAQDPSFVLVGQRHFAAASALGTPGEAIAAVISSPVAMVIGDAQTIGEVVLIETDRSRDAKPDDPAVALAAQLAERLGRRRITLRKAPELPRTSELASGQLGVASATSWEILAASDPPSGAALLLVLEPQLAYNTAPTTEVIPDREPEGPGHTALGDVAAELD